jgi:hypothetical protein
MSNQTSEKCHVSMEQHVCVVCSQAFDTGNIVMDRRLQPTLDRNTITGRGLCPTCTERKAEGYIALVEVDPAKSGRPEGDTVDEETMHKTGRLAHVRKHVMTMLFDVKLPADAWIVAIEPEAFEKLIAMSQRQSSTLQ